MKDRIIFQIINCWENENLNLGINLCSEKVTKRDGTMYYREYYILLNLVFVQIALGFKTDEQLND